MNHIHHVKAQSEDLKLPLLVTSSSSSAATRPSSSLNLSFSVSMFLRASVVSGWPLICCSDPDGAGGASVAGSVSVTSCRLEICPEIDAELGAAGLLLSLRGCGEESVPAEFTRSYNRVRHVQRH